MAGASFSPVRMTASTEEAAVAQALQVVGAARDEVDVEVLKSDAKGVTVRVGPRREPAETTAPETAQAAGKTAAGKTKDGAKRKKKSDGDEPPVDKNVLQAGDGDLTEMAVANPAVAPPVGEAPAGEAPAGEAPEQDLSGSAGTTDSPLETAPPPAAPAAAPPSAPRPVDAAAQERARALAQEFLDRMGMEAQVEIDAAAMASPEAGGDGVARLHLQIEGEDVGILIGKHGQTLQAFQYLLNVTLNNRATDEASTEGSNGDAASRDAALRVVVDAGGYRARRAGSLEQSAREAAARARRDRRSVRLEPMPAYERRLVHLALQEDPMVMTSSEGREPLRHVVVSPAGGQSSGQSSTGAGSERGERGQRASGYGGRGRGGYGGRGGSR